MKKVKAKKKEVAENPYLLTEEEAARYLGISKFTLAAWRKAGTGPPSVRMSWTVIRYRPQDLEQYIDDRLKGVA